MASATDGRAGSEAAARRSPRLPDSHRLPGVTGTLGAITLDRLLGRWRARRDGVPDSLAAVDAAWLGDALREAAGGVPVVAVESLGGHAGTTDRERLRLRFAGDAHPPGAPETVFVKVTPSHPVSRAFASLLDLGASEVAFYRALGGCLPVRVPRVYCARSVPAVGRFALVMEDLEASGCRFPDGGCLGEPEARAVVTALGRLHAAFWESPRLRGELAWLRSPENNRRRALEWWLSKRSHGPALARFGDAVPAAVRGAIGRVHAQRPRLEAHWARLPRTLIHGDSHAGNVFFDGTEAGLFDWQVVQAGPGLRDVAYFLVNSLDTDVRRAHERALLAAYAAALAAGGAAAGEPEAMWREYRLFSLYTWIAVSVTAAAATLQSRDVVARAVQRTGQALADLEALDALDALGASR